MQTLTTQAELDAFCTRAQSHPYVTIDTEFLRERTYYSKLCLLQMAVPGDEEGDAVLVDPLSSEMSLEPLYRLFRDTSVVKVFHAARQDLEIFWVDAEIFPKILRFSGLMRKFFRTPCLIRKSRLWSAALVSKWAMRL